MPSCSFQVLYNYAPRNEDELELKEGDVVDVMEKCDDGWFVGKSGIKTTQFSLNSPMYICLYSGHIFIDLVGVDKKWSSLLEFAHSLLKYKVYVCSNTVYQQRAPLGFE